jgi:hypothetical protein
MSGVTQKEKLIIFIFPCVSHGHIYGAFACQPRKKAPHTYLVVFISHSGSEYGLCDIG